ncbi:MAG: hypothetical protein H6724_10675 [Sandaracinus sp.]|nr:hypothetical protein [Sandaracinus sp.]MCB9619897.1 hypothetical protein [Sandaracinus sp.]
MLTHRGSLWTVLIVGSLTACDCGGNELPTRRCETVADCPGGEVCLDGVCQAPANRDGGPDVGPENRDCVDEDMDGYGEMCVRGPDCDDTDSRQTGTEICDGFDNDCDGVADNGVLNTCGNCEPGCEGTGVGPGTEMPYMPGDENSDGVNVDPEGALVLDSRRINTNFIWIASSAAGTVSKVDTTTYTEVGRYATGSDPSRTSVNAIGDVYVGNRGGQSVTKISALGADCPDTNGDGMITTSAGADVLAFGSDDCVLWRTDLPGSGLVRAVAAQDVEGPDGELRHFVWAGGWNNNRIYKLDGETGAIVLEITAPATAYGFALDGRGRLWMASLTNRYIGFVDTNLCTDSATCEAETLCVASSPEGTECDAATIAKGRIPIPDAGTYGITVDFNQRIWTGGWGGGDHVKRYDPMAASGSRWASVTTSPSGCNGIGADADGFVWAACQGSSVITRVNAETLESVNIPVRASRGVGIDADGKIWAITRNTNEAADVIRPGPTLAEYTIDSSVGPVLQDKYTYSDMTGLQLRLATNPRGFYRHVFEGCEAETDTTVWGDIQFEAETPPGTTVVFRVKTANTREELDALDWTTVGTVPPDTSPLDIAAALSGAGITAGRFLLLEVQLRAERTSSTEIITPRVLGLNVTRTCMPEFG